ncbi:unnamed protein product [Phytophthora lilii]|uniref:Unnamed protein product n=1 Tax=Phytophthora lilii TaxID=2077276 RepID=A0A9W6XS21_9STRA|nr:unnamed protein product [Phytophthora lilii]
MRQNSSENAMKFFYRLNETAVKADNEDLSLDGGYDTPPHRTRDFRTDNPSKRFQLGRNDHAHVGISGGKSESGREGHVWFEGKVLKSYGEQEQESKNPGRASSDTASSEEQSKECVDPSRNV